MIPLARRLRKQNVRKYTQKVLAGMLGVARSTVEGWLMGHNDKSVNMPQRPDARVVIPNAERPKIAAMAKSGKTQRQIAAEYKIDHRTIGRSLKASKKEEDRKKERKARIAKAGKNEKVIHADFRDYAKTMESNSVDLIFTDPPYDRESLPLFGPLGECAARVLRPGGSLITFFGQMALPEVVESLGLHLKYWWMFCVKHEGASARMRAYGVLLNGSRCCGSSSRPTGNFPS